MGWYVDVAAGAADDVARATPVIIDAATTSTTATPMTSTPTLRAHLPHRP